MYQLTTALHRLYDLWWSSLTVVKRRKFTTIRITSTDRSSSIPPNQAPYNFGISVDWMEKYGQKYMDLIGDWGTFEDPNGFGTKAHHLPVLGGDGSLEDYIDLDGGAGVASEN